MLLKAADLTAEQLHEKHAPSDLTNAGLLYHVALVEESWLEVRFAGLPDRPPWVGVDWVPQPNWEFRTAALGAGQVRARYRDACDRSHRVLSDAMDLDQLSVQPLRDGRHFSLRGVLLHLIEETACQAGPARSGRCRRTCRQQHERGVAAGQPEAGTYGDAEQDQDSDDVHAAGSSRSEDEPEDREDVAEDQGADRAQAADRSRD